MKLFASLLLLFFCQTLEPKAVDSVSNEANVLSTPCKPGTWVPASGGQIPEGALPIGLFQGKRTYLARVNRNGAIFPGMLYGSNVYIIIDFKYQHPFYNYEIFCGSDNQFIWIPTETSDVPPNAVKAGKIPKTDGTGKFDRLYLCRVNIDGANIASGPVYQNKCYIGVDFNNVRVKPRFEVLAERKPWLDINF